MTQHLGYIRASTTDQNLDQQREMLAAAGILPEYIYEDTVSGVRAQRPGLDALLAYARVDDTITVVRLDRLGRSLPHMLATFEDLQHRGILLRSLREGIDMTTAGGKAIARFLMVMAEYERDLLRERLAEARASVLARGERWGRKPVLSTSQIAIATAARAAGQSPTTIARSLGCSRSTVYRVTSGSTVAELSSAF